MPVFVLVSLISIGTVALPRQRHSAMEGDGTAQHQYGAVDPPRELEANPLSYSEESVAPNPPGTASSSHASFWRRAGLLGLAGAAAFVAVSGSIPGSRSTTAGAGMDLATYVQSDVTIDVVQSEVR